MRIGGYDDLLGNFGEVAKTHLFSSAQTGFGV